MSPEQATGHVAGPPSDVFSLGAVLAPAATGRPPFGEGPTAVAVMYRVLHEHPDLDGLPDTPARQPHGCTRPAHSAWRVTRPQPRFRH